MGGQQSSGITESGIAHDQSLKATGKIVRTSLGDFLELRDPKGGFALKMTIVFEGAKSAEAIKRGLAELDKAHARNPQLHYLWVRSSQIFDNQLYCASSNATLVLEHFGATLEDLAAAKQLSQCLARESDYWGLLLPLAKVLRFSAHNGFKGGFVHLRTVVWAPSQSGFYLVHPSLLTASNLALAKAGALHFASPEVFACVQKTDADAAVDPGKSDLFSLGLLLVHLLCLAARPLDHDALFNRLTGQFEIAYLDAALRELAKTGVSRLLLAVLTDMTTELAYLRTSSESLLDFFEGREAVLKNPGFQDHAAVLDQYLFSKNARVVETGARDRGRHRSRSRSRTTESDNSEAAFRI